MNWVPSRRKSLGMSRSSENWSDMLKKQEAARKEGLQGTSLLGMLCNRPRLRRSVKATRIFKGVELREHIQLRDLALKEESSPFRNVRDYGVALRTGSSRSLRYLKFQQLPSSDPTLVSTSSSIHFCHLAIFITTLIATIVFLGCSEASTNPFHRSSSRLLPRSGTS